MTSEPGGVPAARTALEAAGAEALVVCGDVDGRLAVEATAGLDVDAVVEAGSLTKVVTGLLLAVLVVEREVSLDDPLSRLLPGAGRAGAVTLVELATHTSGLPRLSLTLLSRALRHPSDPYAGLAVGDLVRAARRARIKARGAARYSNLGVALLGHALARAAGGDYWDVVARRVLQPLGLDDSGDLPDAATWTAGHLWHADAVGPAGGLRAPARDLLRLAVWARAPENTPLGAAFALATSPRVPFGSDHVGLCWMTRDTGAGPVLWHNGGTASSWAFLAAGRRQAVVAAVGGKPDPKLDAAMWTTSFQVG